MIEEKIAKPAAGGSVEHVFSQLVSNASVDSVFGRPVERDGATIIPCSEIIVGFGLGTGTGPIDERGNPMGGGVGGGGGSQGRPIAVVVMTKDGVRVEPVLDLPKVTLADFTT